MFGFELLTLKYPSENIQRAEGYRPEAQRRGLDH